MNIHKVLYQIEEIKKEIACLQHCCDGGGGVVTRVTEADVFLNRSYPDLHLVAGNTQRDFNGALINFVKTSIIPSSPIDFVSGKFTVMSSNIVGSSVVIATTYSVSTTKRHDLYCRGVLIYEDAYNIVDKTITISPSLVDYPLEVGDLLVFKYIKL